METWLASLDLLHHLAAFVRHGITLDQRADLTDADLRELGLTIGERVRYRHAVAALAAAPVPAASPLLETTRAERRPLTMMFVDLVNSSGLAERLEQEDLLETIRGYREFCNDAVVRFGGHVAQFVGDGILAYFCYPVASENDPERAVRAALRIVRGIGGIPVPTDTGSGETGLAVRIGIATGRVIVSDLFTGGKADKASIIGATPNLAARLQALAPRNGIAIADETHQRVQARFDCRSLGPQTLAGFAQPANCWIVRDEITAPGAVGRRARLTPFFSRAPELATLEAGWARATRGDGSALLVTGEAGIGKSRLVENFLETRLVDAGRVIQLNGSAFAEDSPFHPCIAYLRRLAGIDPASPPIVARDRLAAVLGGDAPGRANDLPILTDLLGIADAATPKHSLQPEQLRARTLAIMLAHLLRQADSQPLCLVVEDAHWLDPSTHELLGMVLERLAGRQVLVLLTTRDGLDPRLAKAATLLRLTRLAPEDVAGMIDSLFSGRTLPGELARQIARKTDGVPLFVEEVARSLLLREDIHDGDAAWRTELIDELDESIPASLRESLMGRLDRSGPAKEIAQIAAVVGRSVGRDMLSSVSGMAAPALDQALAMLVDAGVIDRDVTANAESYSFRHALLRDAAYDSLVREHRRDMHFRVARALQSLDEALTGSRPDVLALHLTEAGLAETAAEHWLEAARRSLARSALTEASRLLKRGVAALEKLPASKENLRLRLKLSVLLGPALMSLKGPGSEDAIQLYRRAEEFCRELPDESWHFPIHWGLWRISADFHSKVAQSQGLLRRARRHGTADYILQAHHCNWASHYHAGEFARCAEHVAAGLDLYHQGDYRHHAALYGNHDAKSCGHGEMAQVYWMQGRGRSALAEERRSLEWAQSLDHLGSMVHAMDFAILHRLYRGEHDEVLEQAERLIDFTSEAGLADLRSKGLMFRGWTMAARGEAAAGVTALREGLAYQRAIGTTEDFPVYVCMLAEALIGAGEAAEALQMLREARPSFDTIGLRAWLPEVIRTQGEAMLAASPRERIPASLDAIEALFAEAAALARQQGAEMLALRVAMSTARLDQRLDRLEHSATHLAAALARIPEPEGADVAAAGQLLARLPAPAARAGPTVSCP